MQTLQEIINTHVLEMQLNGNESISFRDSYSGRGMYGKTCIGVSGTNADCKRLIQLVLHETADLAIQAAEYIEKDEDAFYAAQELHDKAIDIMLDFEIDSMGRDYIYYWRTLKTEQ